ncbi:uncharacterized protein Asciz isoform X2 [Epargyreus clarus]|uniref:uncharacterized protein Asciz isoform X2 n=1 Tax=Epargyreus clarus TaxID=520877 RepID=UPI003C2C5BC6
MDIPNVEPDESTVDSSQLCRGCLVSSGEMKNMEDWGLLEDFERITNIKVEPSACTSQLLCINCEEMLLKCQQWIKQCRESDDHMQNIAKQATTTEEQANIKPIISCLLFESNLVVMIVAPDPDAKIYLHCPYKCQNFHKKPDLLQHMINTHRVDKSFTINLQYYCSVSNCPYYINSNMNKFFVGRKQFNQHYKKVHKEKQTCTICYLQFSTTNDFNRHIPTCNFKFECEACKSEYTTKEKLLVHLLRRHPALHKQYKDERKAEKRKAKMVVEAKKARIEEEIDETCDSPTRNFATQTLENIKNDVTLPSWMEKDTRKDEISTQTVFEDLLSMRSDDESIFETVSLSDIQTQTFPIEFGLSTSNKETITCETQSPDLSLKGTQTCLCLYDSPRSNRFLDSVSSSPGMNFTSTETQTADLEQNMTDELQSCSTTETQTCEEIQNL